MRNFLSSICGKDCEDNVAAIDDGYFRTRLSYEPARDQTWREVCRYLQRFVPEESAVLDLGAGYCTFINHIRAREKHALDIHPIIRETAEKNVQTHVRSCIDVGSLKINVDVIFSSFLLEHLDFDELEKTTAGIRDILKPGGTLILVQPNFHYAFREYFDDYTHKLIFTHISLADYITARGFTCTRIEPRFLPYSFKSRLPKIPALVRIYLALPYRPLGKNMLIVARRNPSDAP